MLRENRYVQQRNLLAKVPRTMIRAQLVLAQLNLIRPDDAWLLRDCTGEAALKHAFHGVRKNRLRILAPVFLGDVLGIR